MKYNENAFSSVNDRKYRNWDGYSLVYTYEFIDSIKSLLDFEKIDTIFDIGSRDACQAHELADWFPSSSIHLFEPVVSSFNWCVNSTKERVNIKCNNIALSNYSGISSFYEVTNGNIGASSLLKVDEKFQTGMLQNEVKITVDTAKNYIEKNKIKSVDLVWADVQGSEIECFSGFEEHIENIKAIHTEVAYDSFYHNGTNLSKLDDFMKSKNFETIKIIHNSLGIEVDVVYVNKKFINQ